MDISGPTSHRWDGWPTSRGAREPNGSPARHGPACPDPAGLLADYAEHRRERLDLVAAALAAGTTAPDDLLAVVYPEVPPALRWAARLSLAAQVEYLTDRAPGIGA